MVLTVGPAHAFLPALDRAAAERAITLGRSSDPVALDRIRAAYRIDIGDATLERLEILTPFRRLVFEAAARARADERPWAPGEALAWLAPFRNRLALVLSVRFSPQNVLVTMPAYDLVIYRRGVGGGSAIQPIEVRATPRDVAGRPVPPGSPMVQGTVEAVFDARRLDPQGIYLVGIRQNDRDLRRVEIDLGRVD